MPSGQHVSTDLLEDPFRSFPVWNMLKEQKRTQKVIAAYVL
jgi:hypothetical protein